MIGSPTVIRRSCTAAAAGCWRVAHSGTFDSAWLVRRRAGLSIMRKRRVTVVVPLLIAAASLSCGDDDEPGLPNPAAVFCEEQGGHVEIERDDAGNERGICVLHDGIRVDEWEYFRSHHPEADRSDP